MSDRDNFHPYNYTQARTDSERHTNPSWNGDTCGAEEAMTEEQYAAKVSERGW